MSNRKNRAGAQGQPRRDRRSDSFTDSSEISSDSNRGAWVLVFFLALTVLFFLRLFYLQVIVAPEYSTQAQEARTAYIETTARRGTIYDRNGNILATSVETKTIYANPLEVENVDTAAKQLVEILGGEEKDYREKLTKSDTSFVYVQRKADIDVADKVKELEIDGIYFLPESKRVYPYGQVGGQIIGFVGIDDEALTGLELYYDDVLKGVPGTLRIERGGQGIPIPGGLKEETAAIDGQDIIVSLDIGLQEYVEESLSAGADSLGGSSGNSIVMDAGTGEIYACASTPYFNPAEPENSKEGSTTIKGISYAFEPGSIFKTVSALAVLEEKAMKPETEIFCPATLQADEYVISDAAPRGDQTMTFTEVLNNSSNIGISLSTQKIGFSNFYDKIVNQYRLTEPTGIDYPGEASGWVDPYEEWSIAQAYNVSFGQGISSTSLQMTNFYAALRNDGVQNTPHFLLEKPLTGETPEYESHTITTDMQALEQLTGMLESVITDGTAPEAAVEGYAVAGKTSTAEVADEAGGYRKGVYTICFTGFLPHSSSKLVCFVGVEEVPGDRKVTPIFSDIMTFAADRYRVVPS